MARIENCTSYDTHTVRKITRWCLKEMGLSRLPELLVRLRYTSGRSAYSGRAYSHVVPYSPRDRRREARESKKARKWGDYCDYESFRPTIPKGISRYCLVRIWKPEFAKYPVALFGYNLKSGPPPRVCANWQEVFVAILGHELQHFVQFQARAKKGRSAVKLSEVETSWAEHRLLAAWKNHCAEEIGELVKS